MRNGWQLKKLGDFISEYSVKNKCNETIPVYSVTNSQGFCKDYFSKEVASQDKSTYKIVPYGCFAYNPSRINVGSVNWQNKEERVIVSPLYTVFSVSENLNRDFLLYFIKSNGTMGIINSLATGTVRLNLKLSMLKEFLIIVPPLSTQLSIVSELDKINELIRLKKEQLKDYDNLAQSIFYEMFGDPVVNEKGWEVKKLGEVAMIKTGPFGSMLHKEDYITGGIPLINPMHIQNFKAVPDKYFTISKEKAAELCDYQLKINDVIFARRGDIGRCAVISDKEAGYLCGTGSLFVRFERKLSSIYTMYVVRTTSFIKELVSKAKGATMLNLNSSTMENLRFPIPPLPLQQAFAQRIELIKKQKAEIQNTIADLETLLASRMQYWFD